MCPLLPPPHRPLASLPRPTRTPTRTPTRVDTETEQGAGSGFSQRTETMTSPGLCLTPARNKQSAPRTKAHNNAVPDRAPAHFSPIEAEAQALDLAASASRSTKCACVRDPNQPVGSIAHCAGSQALGCTWSGHPARSDRPVPGGASWRAVRTTRRKCQYGCQQQHGGGRHLEGSFVMMRCASGQEPPAPTRVGTNASRQFDEGLSKDH